MKKFLFYMLIFFTAVMISCSGAEKKGVSDAVISGAGDEKSAELKSRIAEINNNLPCTIRSNVTIDGDNKGKKFRFEGTLLHNSFGYTEFKVVDYIFKGAVVDFYKNQSDLFFYYPAERKLYIDKIEKINFEAYTGFPIDFSFVHTLLTGGVPLIKDGVAVKSFVEANQDAYHLIIESSEFFQNIYVRKDVPEKILVIHKKSMEKVEVYINSYRKKDESLFFSKLRVVIPGSDLSINIKFTGIRLNDPLKIEPFLPEKIKGAEIIKVN
ncbi:MAG: DUF4292 domain-containing protein [Spirochaetota bacterium]